MMHHTMKRTEIEILPISQPMSPKISIQPPSSGGDVKAYPLSIPEFTPDMIHRGERVSHERPWLAIKVSDHESFVRLGRI